MPLLTRELFVHDKFITSINTRVYGRVDNAIVLVNPYSTMITENGLITSEYLLDMIINNKNNKTNTRRASGSTNTTNNKSRNRSTGHKTSHTRTTTKNTSHRTSRTTTMKTDTTVWTDGSALDNPRGAMGWAWADDKGKRDAGGAAMGTNQIGELTAVFMALMAHPNGSLKIVSDSQYVINVCEKWSKSWKRNDWTLRSGEKVKNLPLVKAIRRILDTREGKVYFEWTKGHAGNTGNEIVDELARTYAIQCQHGKANDRMPPEGQQTLEESTVVQTGQYEKRKTRTLNHRPGDSPKGHWRMVTDKPHKHNGDNNKRH